VLPRDSLISGATGDKLSWVWYIIGLCVVSFLATLAIRTPGSFGRKSQAEQPAGMLAGASN
jgi:hypothetical protein